MFHKKKDEDSVRMYFLHESLSRRDSTSGWFIDGEELVNRKLNMSLDWNWVEQEATL